MTQEKHRFLLGAHISAATNIALAFERGAAIGCTTIQIFTKNNRQWKANTIPESDSDAFKIAQKKLNIFPVVAHATYLINLGALDKQILQKSRELLKTELDRCQQLEIPYLVLHPGAYTSGTEKECLDRIIESLDYVLKNRGETSLLLENMAGQGTSVCYKLEDLAHIFEKISDKKRLGVCVDTCHAFVAGYDFRTEKEYEKTWRFFDELIGLKNLKVIHLNDSKKDLGSRIDRHENIGNGMLGLEAFRLICNDERFFDIAKILETPAGGHTQDIKTIYNLLSQKTKKILSID